MALTATKKLDIAKDVMQSLEWMTTDIKDFDSWKKVECWRFDEEQYLNDDDYKTEKDSDFAKYVENAKYRNLLVEKIIDAFKGIIAKNI